MHDAHTNIVTYQTPVLNCILCISYHRAANGRWRRHFPMWKKTEALTPCKIRTLEHIDTQFVRIAIVGQVLVRQFSRYVFSLDIRICPQTILLPITVSHAQYVPTLTGAAAWRVKAAVSKADWWPWPLTFWSWKWYPSNVGRGLPLCQF